MPPAPEIDSAVPPEELLAEMEMRHDSAADQAVLEALAGGAPADDAEAEDGARGGPGPTWDINVTTFTNHDRVKYYLDFFRGPGRERFGIWLTRMPRYEGMIRERLQKEGTAGRPRVPRADRERLVQHRHQPRPRRGHVAVHEGDGKTLRPAGRFVGGRAPGPYRATDAAARHLRDLTSRFGSLYLAAAAYNAGAGKVSRGLGRLPDDESDSRQHRCHLLPSLRYQAASPGNEGLRPQADRGGAHREGAGALRVRSRRRAAEPRPTIPSSCRA